jgi:hypothetical protein
MALNSGKRDGTFAFLSPAATQNEKSANRKGQGATLIFNPQSGDFLRAVRHVKTFHLDIAITIKRQWAIFTTDPDFSSYARVLPLRIHTHRRR